MDIPSGKLFIADEAVGEITIDLKSLPSTDMELTCDVDFEWRFPVPLYDIEFSYVGHRRKLFVDVPVQNDVHIRGTRITETNTVEGEHETTCEIGFQGGDWTYEIEAVTWKRWWEELWARLSTKFATLLGR